MKKSHKVTGAGRHLQSWTSYVARTSLVSQTSTASVIAHFPQLLHFTQVKCKSFFSRWFTETNLRTVGEHLFCCYLTTTTASGTSSTHPFSERITVFSILSTVWYLLLSKHIHLKLHRYNTLFVNQIRCIITKTKKKPKCIIVL